MNRWIVGRLLVALALTRRWRPQAAVLVVRSSGPSAKAYPGRQGAARQLRRITLRGNDVVILLDSRGTRTLRGPGNYSTSASAGGSTSAMAASAASRTPGAAASGRCAADRPARPRAATCGRPTSAARAMCASPIRPTSACIAPIPARAAEVTLTEDGERQPRATVEFAAGQKNAPWPAALCRSRRVASIRSRARGAPVTLNASRSRRSRPGSKAWRKT